MLSIMKENNVRMLTASDAHCPEDAGYKIKEMSAFASYPSFLRRSGSTWKCVERQLPQGNVGISTAYKELNDE